MCCRLYDTYTVTVTLCCRLYDTCIVIMAMYCRLFDSYTVPVAFRHLYCACGYVLQAV